MPSNRFFCLPLPPAPPRSRLASSSPSCMPHKSSQPLCFPALAWLPEGRRCIDKILSFRNSSKARLSCQPPSQALVKDPCPDWEPVGALDSGIRYGDCVQP